jgi:secondary thiamine-phosphate synthase enzyme
MLKGRLLHRADLGALTNRSVMERFNLEVQTDGNTDIVNLSPELSRRVRDGRGSGIVSLFVIGSTAALTTLEFETGLVKHDVPNLFQKLIPDDARYAHEATWNDDNGHSHIRAAFIGASLTIPFADGKLLTGEHQQVVLIDFDTRPRKRTIVCTLLP